MVIGTQILMNILLYRLIQAQGTQHVINVIAISLIRRYSAGRIPTDKAYRYYVDHMLGALRLDQAIQQYIHQYLSADDHPVVPGTAQLMAKTSHVLSEVSRSVGMVLGPALEEKILEHVKFIRLYDCRVLVVVVSKPDLVENKVVQLQEEFTQEDLDRAAEYLNSGFRGWSLRTIRVEIFKRL